MDGAKEFLKKKGSFARISFKDKKPHTFELVKDKVETIKTNDGDVEGVKFLVKENGELTSFFTSSEALISKLSQHKAGDTVTVQLVSKNINGQFRSVYNVNGGAEKEGTDQTPPEEDVVDITPPDEDF
jgi:hypothetical protein